MNIGEHFRRRINIGNIKDVTAAVHRNNIAFFKRACALYLFYENLFYKTR